MISFEIIARARQEQQEVIDAHAAMAMLENPRITQAELYEVMIASVARQYGVDGPTEGIKAVIDKAVSLFPNSNALHTALAWNSRSVANEYPALLAATTDEGVLMQVATCNWPHEFNGDSDIELREQLLEVQGSAIDKIGSEELINELCGYSTETTRALGMQRQTDRRQVLALLGHKRRPLTTSDIGNLAPRWASDPDFEAIFMNRAVSAIGSATAEMLDYRNLPNPGEPGYARLDTWSEGSIRADIQQRISKAAWLADQVAQGIVTDDLALELINLCRIAKELTGAPELDQVPRTIAARFANRSAVVGYLFESGLGLKEIAANTQDSRINSRCQKIVMADTPTDPHQANVQERIAMGYAARDDVAPKIAGRLAELARDSDYVRVSIAEHAGDFETIRTMATLKTTYAARSDRPHKQIQHVYETAREVMGASPDIVSNRNYRQPTPLIRAAQPEFVLSSLS